MISKDPAFLFYPSDFTTGTQFFTDDQIGKYMRLLIAQHQHGHLTKKQMLFICKEEDEMIFDKFLIDEKGKFYNARLDTEMAKRAAYSLSRKNNRYGKDMKGHMSGHMENINENRNKDENKIKKVSSLVGDEVVPLSKEKLIAELLVCEEMIEAQAMKHGQSKQRIIQQIKTFVGDKWPTGELKKSVGKIKSHFTASLNYVKWDNTGGKTNLTEPKQFKK